MKKIFLLFIFTLFVFYSCKKTEMSTYYLIRHAEKIKTDADNRNPYLNEKGLKRADNWAKYFKNIKIDAVYSTNYHRTTQTAKPTAESKNLEIIKYDPRKLYDETFRAETKGKNVLIIGHSNTTPAFANKILGEKKFQNMNENNNTSLYVVTVSGDKKTRKVITVN